MTERPQVTRLEPLGRFVAIIAFMIAAWAIMLHFDSPTTDINPTFRSGFGALLEQIGIAITFPTYFTNDWTAPAERLPIIAIQYWPLLILCFRPWRDLSRGVRYAIAIYSLLTFLGIGLLFLHLRHHWHQDFLLP